MAVNCLSQERFWENKAECDDAELKYQLKLSGAKAETVMDENDIDFFASDDEAQPRAKPVFIKVQPKAQQKQAKQPAKPAAKEKAEIPPAASTQKSTKPETVVNANPTGNTAKKERTFLMLKPDAVQRGLAGKIIARFEKKGFKLVAMKFVRASVELLEKHYSDLSKKPFFAGLVSYMASGPLLPMVWEGLNIVKTGRVMLGETNPRDSAPGTIRGDFCVDIGRNIIHGSDSIQSAEKEIKLWFRPEELVDWRPSQITWVYEDEELEPEPKQVDCGSNMASGDLIKKLNALELENKNLKKVTDDLHNLVLTLEKRVASLEGSSAPAPKPAAEPAKEAEDDDVDLFGSSDEEEDEEAARVREERLKAYAEKKAKKPALIAKTSVLLDVKPWDDETDMDAMLKCVKSIEKDGLVWGASKLVPVGYGINKLQVMCVVEDEKVSIDELSEQIQEFEDYVQSVDIAAMSKI